MYLFTQEITDTDHLVVTIGTDESILNEEELQEAIVVESVPKAEKIIGKVEELHVNPETKEMWYEYVDRPLTETEVLAQRLDNLELAFLQSQGVI